MSQVPTQFDNVSVVCKANVYFEGDVISHTVLTPQGKKSLGLIFPGAYKFNTDAPERMDIISGSCRVRQAGQHEWTHYAAGTFFTVAAKSSFEISVEALTEYICSFG